MIDEHNRGKRLLSVKIFPFILVFLTTVIVASQLKLKGSKDKKTPQFNCLSFVKELDSAKF
jgi:hypothetical protein